ncbi:MAG: DegT/DnrJ/EryC1/StrS family aminotransferase, partial [Planctomycetes bacterium]|nr:DegT/DnrJ/EryC1/StrS family aminotransferase [Planctomycetota bacterium]
MIPICVPYLDHRELEAIRAVLDSGWLTHGPHNAEFERRFAAYLGVEHAISLNSCASALFLALEGLDLRGEVILPSFTFVASANAVVTAGCTPVFADIDAATCNIDPDDVESKITPRTVAIMPVHYAGQCCRMDRILDIARRHGLHVIEDSAETIGGRFQERLAGSFGTGCFSFFPTKNLTTAEGGMLTTNDGELAARVRALSGHGIAQSTHEKEKSERPWLRSAILPGFNMRMSNVHAAIGAVQLAKLEEMNELRRSHAARLTRLLSEVEEVATPVEAPDCFHSYQMYTIRVPARSRNGFLNRMRASGVGASVHFEPPVHLQDYYQRAGLGALQLPVTELVAASIVTLPMYPGLEERQIEQIAACVKECIAAERPGGGAAPPPRRAPGRARWPPA